METPKYFYEQSVRAEPGTFVDEVLPVSAARLMGEWLANDFLSVITLVSLPLESQTTLKNGIGHRF